MCDHNGGTLTDLTRAISTKFDPVSSSQTQFSKTPERHAASLKDTQRILARDLKNNDN